MTSELIVAALGLGFVGSLHCLGMCGPIALALPVHAEDRPAAFVVGRLLYNLGRIVTYTIMGAGMGALGAVISLAGWQRGLMIATGVVILLGLFMPKRWFMRVSRVGVFSRLIGRFRQAWARRFRGHSLLGLLVIGLLNGFLPCGLVYAALASATVTGSVLGGMAFMALFGLGTAPAMFAVALLGKLLDTGLRHAFRRVVPVTVFCLAVLFILHGLALGIPYISPNPKPNSHASCCSP